MSSPLWWYLARATGVVAWLLFLPRLRLPASFHGPVLAIARASFLVYLLHRFVPELLMPALNLNLPGWTIDTVAVLGGIGPFAGTIGFVYIERNRFITTE